MDSERAFRRYLRAVEDRWASEYYAWVQANLKAEAWTVMAGVISPAAVSLFAYFVWPADLPITLKEALLGAAGFGLVGGLVAFLALFLSISVKARIVAPYRLWAADRKAIEELTKTRACLEAEALKQAERLAGREADIERLGAELARLTAENAGLDKACSQLQAQLASVPKLELIPRRLSRLIDVLPAPSSSEC